MGCSWQAGAVGADHQEGTRWLGGGWVHLVCVMRGLLCVFGLWLLWARRKAGGLHRADGAWVLSLGLFCLKILILCCQDTCALSWAGGGGGGGQAVGDLGQFLRPVWCLVSVMTCQLPQSQADFLDAGGLLWGRLFFRNSADVDALAAHGFCLNVLSLVCGGGRAARRPGWRSAVFVVLVALLDTLARPLRSGCGFARLLQRCAVIAGGGGGPGPRRRRRSKGSKPLGASVRRPGAGGRLDGCIEGQDIGLEGVRPDSITWVKLIGILFKG